MHVAVYVYLVRGAQCGLWGTVWRMANCRCFLSFSAGGGLDLLGVVGKMLPFIVVRYFPVFRHISLPNLYYSRLLRSYVLLDKPKRNSIVYGVVECVHAH